VPFGDFGGPFEEHAVGAQKPAVRPGDEQAHEEEGDAQDGHQVGGIHAEDPHEGIVAADEEVGAGGGKKDGQGQIDIGDDSQGMPQPGGHGKGPDDHQVLDGPQGTGAATEDPSEEKGEDQGQQEKEQHGHGDGVGGIGKGEDNILEGSHGADTAVAVKTEIEQREEGEPENPLAGTFSQDHPGTGTHHRHQKGHIEPLHGRGTRLRRHRVGLLIPRFKLGLGKPLHLSGDRTSHRQHQHQHQHRNGPPHLEEML